MPSIFKTSAVRDVRVIWLDPMSIGSSHMDRVLNRPTSFIDALRALCAVRHYAGVPPSRGSLGLCSLPESHKIKRLETSHDCELLSRKAGAALFTAAGEICSIMPGASRAAR